MDCPIQTQWNRQGFPKSELLFLVLAVFFVEEFVALRIEVELVCDEPFGGAFS